MCRPVSRTARLPPPPLLTERLQTVLLGPTLVAARAVRAPRGRRASTQSKKIEPSNANTDRCRAMYDCHVCATSPPAPQLNCGALTDVALPSTRSTHCTETYNYLRARWGAAEFLKRRFIS